MPRDGDGRRVFLLGYPSECGGACTEAWHTIKLWRHYGVDVHLIPTWTPEDEWVRRTTSIGCTTHHVPAGQLRSVSGLAGGTCICFCNRAVLDTANLWRSLTCRIVWVNCMTWMSAMEKCITERDGPFAAYVFQSAYQRDRLWPELQALQADDEQAFMIRGAFDVGEFPFSPRPHREGEPFVVGRLSRHAPDKYHPDSWDVYRSVGYRPLKVRVMGWNDEIEEKLGEPPDFAECLPEKAETAREFLESLHCLCPIVDDSRENWPRTGLEAMAAGVPIVTQNEWGWREMIEDGVSGSLGTMPYDIAPRVGALANNEALRHTMAWTARSRVELLSDPASTWAGWRRVFDFVETD